MASDAQKQKAIEPQVVEEVRRHRRSIDQLLPRGFGVDRFVAMTFDAFRQTPALLECPVQSVLGGALAAAKMGLSPNTPLQQCWLVANWNGSTRRKEAELWLGFRGAITLATRARSVTRVWAEVVYECDEFEYEKGSEPRLMHRPKAFHRDQGGLRPMILETDGQTSVDPRGQLVAAYACARSPDGFVIHHVMPAIDVIRIRDSCLASKRNPKTSPWFVHEAAMWRKSPVKPLAKFIEVPESSAEGFRLDGLAEAGTAQQLDKQWGDLSTSSAHVQVPGDVDPPALSEPKTKGPKDPDDVAGAMDTIGDILDGDDGRSGEAG